MATVPSETPATRGLGWLVRTARAYRVKLAVYLTLIVGFWAALVAVPRNLDMLLPAFPNDREWVRNRVAVGIGLSFPTAVLLVNASVLPAPQVVRQGTRAILQYLRAK